MALAFSLETSGESNGTLGVIATSSVTVATDSLVWGVVALRGGDPANPSVMSCSGLGFTWDKAVQKNLSNRSLAVFRAMGTGASGVVTFTSDRLDPVGFTWGIVEVTGAVTGTNGLAAVNNVQPIDSGTLVLSGTQPTLTISGTPAAGDMTFAIIATEDGESGLTEEGGWTNILRLIGTLETSIDIMYNTSQDLTASWTGCRTDGREALFGGALVKTAAAGGRTTKNTRSAPLGTNVGMGLRMKDYQRPHDQRLYRPDYSLRRAA